MESFKFLLLGITGVSVIFWVCVIALWLTSIYPSLFKEENMLKTQQKLKSSTENIQGNDFSSLIKKGALRPLIKGSTLIDRSKYSRKSLVVADFSVGENEIPNHKVYTVLLISLGAMSFLIISYGLMPSGLTFLGFKI